MKRSLRLQIPIFIATRTLINTAVRMVYPFLPVFGRGLGVDLSMLSLGLTLRSASGIFGPLLAFTGDRWGRKAGMLFGLTLFTLGIALLVFWPSYPAFIAMLVISLMGNFVFLPSMQAYLGDHVAYRRRALALASTEFSWSLSFIVGVPVCGLLIAQRGWQAPFPIIAGLGMLAWATLFFMLPRNHTASGEDKPSLRRNLHKVFTHAPALAGITIALSISASNELVNLIFGVWIEDTFKVQIATLAAASVVIGASELVGEALVFTLTDRLGKSRSVGMGLALNSLAVLTLPVLGRSLGGALVGLFLLYLTFEFALVSSIPLMTEVLPMARATFMAIYIACMALGRALGALLSPHLYNAVRGILVIALVAASLNLVALFALRLVKTSESTRKPTGD